MTGVVEVVGQEVFIKEVFVIFHTGILGMELLGKLMHIVQHDGMDQLLIGLVNGWGDEDETNSFLLGLPGHPLIDIPNPGIGFLVDDFGGVQKRGHSTIIPVGQSVFDV